MDVFGVRVDEVDLPEALLRIKLRKGKPFFVVTPNPEQIVQAQGDAEFRQILNSADLAIPDGVGLRLVGIKQRVTGIKLMEALLRQGHRLRGRSDSRSSGRVKKVMMVGGKRGWPDVAKINRIRPDYLFVGLGAPKQEKWINQNLDKLKVGVVMAVGGAIDQLDDPSLRPPQWIEQIGLGWLYRLLRQPWRWRRQLRLLQFGWMVVRRKLVL